MIPDAVEVVVAVASPPQVPQKTPHPSSPQASCDAQDGVQQGSVLHAWLAAGLLPAGQSASLAVVPLHSHQTSRVWVPPSQGALHALQEPVCQLKVHGVQLGSSQ